MTSLIACNRTDFSNPEAVIKDFRKLSLKGLNAVCYDKFLSTQSKTFVTKDEFVKTRKVSDTIQGRSYLLESKTISFPADITNPSYRRIKVEEKTVSNTDTIYKRLYYTLINENGHWKVIWTGTLQSFADKMFQDGNYSSAIKAIDKIIAIDPFNGALYQMLAKTYLRDNSLPQNIRDKKIVDNAKYAIALENDNSDNYNMLAAYYSGIQNYDLAIQYLERGIPFCQDKKDKAYLYSNLAGYYYTNGDMKKGEYYIKKSIELNDGDAFAWFKYGTFMQQQNKIDKAISCYEKAIERNSREKLGDNTLEAALFYSYSYCCFQGGKCATSKEYINKALDLAPDNKDYQRLYEVIKDCNNKNALPI